MPDGPVPSTCTTSGSPPARIPAATVTEAPKSMLANSGARASPATGASADRGVGGPGSAARLHRTLWIGEQHAVALEQRLDGSEARAGGLESDLAALEPAHRLAEAREPCEVAVVHLLPELLVQVRR